MICLTKLNGVPFVLNSELIETIEENPDTTIHLTNKSYLIVREPMNEIIERVIEFKRATNDVLMRILPDQRKKG